MLFRSDTSTISPHIGQILIGPQEWIDVVEDGMKDPDAFAAKYKELGMHFVKKEEAAS